ALEARGDDQAAVHPDRAAVDFEEFEFGPAADSAIKLDKALRGVGGVDGEALGAGDRVIDRVVEPHVRAGDHVVDAQHDGAYKVDGAGGGEGEAIQADRRPAQHRVAGDRHG